MNLVIEIKNFRCYKNIIVEIEPGVSLFNGESGSGKSTIFNAILWCLYGSIRNIKPKNKKNCKTEVILSFKKFLIHRVSSPKELTLEYNKENCLKDDESQEFINNYFGDESFFIATSYISQEKKCFLLEGKNTEKIELINSIIYGSPKGKQSEKIINKIKDKIKEFENNLTKEKIIMNTYNELIKDMNLESELKFDNDDLDKERKKNIVNKKKEIDLLVKFEENENNIMKIEKIKKKIEKIEKEIDYDLLKNNDGGYTLLINKYNNDFGRLKKLSDIRNEKTEYDIKKNNFEKNKDIIINYTEEQIKEVLKLEKENELLLSYFKKENYSQELKEKKEEIFKLLIKYYEIIYEYKWIKDKKVPELVEYEDINFLKKELDVMKTGGDLIICPKCNSKLLYENGKLKDTNIEKKYTSEEIKAKEKEIKIKEDKYKYMTEYNIHYEKCKNLNDSSKKEIERVINHNINIDKNELINSYEILRKLKYNKINIGSEEMKKRKNLFSEHKKFVNLYKDKIDFLEKYDENEFENVHKNITELSIKIKKIEENNLLKEKLKYFEKEISEIKIYENLDHEILKIKNEIIETDNKIKIIESFLKKNDLEKKINVCSKMVNKFQTKIADLKILLSFSIEAENMVYDSTIEYINKELNNYLIDIFKEDIIVTIDFKKKEKFSLNIIHNGLEYDKINQLSGGESDRISLALILVLKKLNLNSPFLFLDECFSSLDLNNKDVCFNLIKQNFEEFVIMINHDAVENNYDNIINFPLLV